MEIDKVKESIRIMKDAYDVYNACAKRSLENGLNEDYWHWKGIAEGTRRSWELLEELFDLAEDEVIECDGRCLNCDNYETPACPDKH